MHVMLKSRIESRQAMAAVIGLGYAGLPLALEMCNSDFDVYGIDTSKNRISSLNKGKSYVSDIKDVQIAEVINRKLFAGNNFSVIKNADIIIICVPTPLNKVKEPDVSYIKSAVAQVAKYIRKGTLVVLESTTYPGTTEELVTCVIESKKGMQVGKDFFVCYSPERVDPGNKYFNVKNTPRIIGGSTKKCLELGIVLYDTFIKRLVPVSSTRVAEMVKLLENTFRSVNIALINEMTQMSDSMGINIWEAVDAASSKPFGFMPFYPGPGTGGHCIPLDPIYLSWKGKTCNYFNRFIELADDINSNMPGYVFKQIKRILSKKDYSDACIFIIGIAYKKDVDDLRESPAVRLLGLLMESGAGVKYYDPYIPTLSIGGYELHSCEPDSKNLHESDIVVIATDHTCIDYQFIADNSKVVYDTRNAAKNCRTDNIILMGG